MRRLFTSSMAARGRSDSHDLSRRLPAAVSSSLRLAMPVSSRPTFWQRSRMRRLQFRAGYYFIEDRAVIPLHKYPRSTAPSLESYLRARRLSRPQIREISEGRDVVRGLQRGYELHALFSAESENEGSSLHALRTRSRVAGRRMLWRLKIEESKSKSRQVDRYQRNSRSLRKSGWPFILISLRAGPRSSWCASVGR